MNTPDDSYLGGAREIAPLALGVAIYGLAYGLMANQAGFSPLDVAGMGVIVLAGGSQIVATQQWLPAPARSPRSLPASPSTCG